MPHRHVRRRLPKRLPHILVSSAKLLEVAATRLPAWAVLRSVVPKEQRHRLEGRLLADALMRLGPVYIKMGQIFSTHSDLLPEEVCEALGPLRDEVPGMSREQLEAVLTRSYGMSMEALFQNVFSEFDYEPIASASIAQVHRARLRTGEEVAVKVVKAGVKEELEANLLVFEAIFWLLSQFGAGKRQDFLRRYREIKDLLIHQTDMALERRNQQRLYKINNGVYCKIPKVYEAYSSKDVTVMEFVHGIPGDSPHLVKGDRKELLFRIQTGLFDALHYHGLVHGDPHPGNVCYTEDGKFCLFDFGIVVELSEQEKLGYISLLSACYRREWDLAVKRFTRYFVVNTETIEANYDAYVADLKPVFIRHYDESTQQWSMVRFLKDVLPVLEKYDAQYCFNLAKASFMMLTGEGLGRLIAPDADWMENARRYTEMFSPYASDKVREAFDAYFRQHTPRSLELRDRARKHLSAPNNLDRYFFPSDYPLFIESAQGCRVTDVDGNTYIDLLCGYGPHILGYNPPIVRLAIQQQLEKGIYNGMPHRHEMELAEIIADALPGAESVVFANTGTEAVLEAIRLCRGYRERDTVAKFEGHYHGFSDQALVSAWYVFDGTVEEPQPISPPGVPKGVIQDTVVLQYGLARSLERIEEEADRLACVILEPMPAALASYDTAFLRQLREVCTRHDIPLIFDEVVTGFRVAYGGIQGLTGVCPDLTCLGKIIGGGAPAGAVAGKNKYIDLCRTSGDPYLDLESRVFIGSTFSGNTLTCAAGKAMLTYLRDHPEIYDDLDRKTQVVKTRFLEAAHRHGVPLQMVANRTFFSMKFGRGTYTNYREMHAGANVRATISLGYYMRKHGVHMPEFSAMFLCTAHTDEDIDHVCLAFDRSLAEMVEHGVFHEQY